MGWFDVQLSHLSQDILTKLISFAGDIMQAVDSIGHYCYEHKEEPFIKESDTGPRWADIYEHGYDDVDQLLENTSLFADWVPFADDGVTTVVTTLINLVKVTGISVNACIQLLAPSYVERSAESKILLDMYDKIGHTSK